MARDQERARSYTGRRITRSQARENGHTDLENIEKVRSNNESQFSDTAYSIYIIILFLFILINVVWSRKHW